MKNFLWWLIYFLEDNWGYSTPIQKRYKIGDWVKFSPNSQYLVPHTPVVIKETGRFDYLVEDRYGILYIVKQFDLYD